MSGVVRTFAPAKINLSLHVHGRRDDGYHELTSLVVFADVGDHLTLSPSMHFSLNVSGPSAGQIDGPNLIATAAERLRARVPSFEPGTISLHKSLPVGAGVGGGSSDAAAYLRAARAANPAHASQIDWPELALSLGADVPVCLYGKTTWMCGIGERLRPLATPLAPMHAVLANPGSSVSTAKVFRALDAGPLKDTTFSRDAFINLEHLSNDLEAPALRVAPDIELVRQALEATQGVRLVRMSGSGATFFGIYDDRNAAEVAAHSIKRSQPNWWVEATTLGDAPSDNLID